ncbi:MAG: hypothetical protein WAL75_18800 [Terracidiphilus sp.]
MKAGQSYLRSMTRNIAGSPLPPLRASSVPVWPVRPLGAEFLKETVPYADTLPPRTRDSDTLESQTTFQNPVESGLTARVESRPITRPDSATTEKTASAKRAARMNREGQEQLQPLSSVRSQMDSPLQERLTPENELKSRRSETQASAKRRMSETISQARPEMPDSAAAASLSSYVSGAVGVSESDNSQTRHKPASDPSSRLENSGERYFREDPLQPNTSKRSYSQLEPAPVAAAQFAGPREQGEAEGQNSVHIGKIDIHIAPPPAPAAPRQTIPTNSRAALARGFLSSFGLRQG